MRKTVFNSAMLGDSAGITYARNYATRDGNGAAVAANVPSYGKRHLVAEQVEGSRTTLATLSGNVFWGGGRNHDDTAAEGFAFASGDGNYRVCRGPISGGALPFGTARSLTMTGDSGKTYAVRDAFNYYGLKAIYAVRINGSAQHDGIGIFLANSDPDDASATLTFTGVEDVATGVITTAAQSAGTNRGSTLGSNGTAHPIDGFDPRLRAMLVFADYQINPGAVGGQVIAIEIFRDAIGDDWQWTDARTIFGEVLASGTHFHNAGVCKIGDDLVFVRIDGDSAAQNRMVLGRVPYATWLTGDITVCETAHGTLGQFGGQFTGIAPLNATGRFVVGCDNIETSFYEFDISDTADLDDTEFESYKLSVKGLSPAIRYNGSTTPEMFRFGVRDGFTDYVAHLNIKTGGPVYLLYSPDGIDWSICAEGAAGGVPSYPSWYDDKIVFASSTAIVSYDKPTYTYRSGLQIGSGGKNYSGAQSNFTAADAGITWTLINRNADGLYEYPAGPLMGQVMEDQPRTQCEVWMLEYDGTPGSDSGGIRVCGPIGSMTSTGGENGVFWYGAMSLVSDGVRFGLNVSGSLQGAQIYQANRSWSYNLITGDIQRAAYTRASYEMVLTDGQPTKLLFTIPSITKDNVRGYSLAGGPPLPTLDTGVTELNGDLGDATLDATMTGLGADWGIVVGLRLDDGYRRVSRTIDLLSLVDTDDTDSFVNIEATDYNAARIIDDAATADSFGACFFEPGNMVAIAVWKDGGDIYARLIAGDAQSEANITSDFDPDNITIKIGRGHDDTVGANAEVVSLTRYESGFDPDSLDLSDAALLVSAGSNSATRLRYRLDRVRPRGEKNANDA